MKRKSIALARRAKHKDNESFGKELDRFWTLKLSRIYPRFDFKERSVAKKLLADHVLI